MGKEFYVIILEGDEDHDSPTWDFVAKRNTRVEIEAVTQYSASDSESRSKSEYEGECCSGPPKELTNTQTGDRARGHTYKLAKKE